EQPAVPRHARDHAVLQGRPVRQGQGPHRRVRAVPHQAVHARGAAVGDPAPRSEMSTTRPGTPSHHPATTCGKEGSSQPAGPSRGGTMARILIIDDSPTDTRVFTTVLEKHGHEVLAAASAEDGVEVCRREKPDLVLMDVILPGMNGFQATRSLSRDAET